MAAQESIPIAATVLGLIGTIFWCVQLLPQIWFNYRRKKTEGLPAIMMFLWAISGVPFGIYAIVQNLNIPLQVQPQIFMALSLTAWAQCLHYNSGWRSLTSGLLALVLLLVFGGIEAGVIIALRPAYTTTAITVVGVIAAVLLVAGLVPPYFELVKRSGRVVGLNFIFLTVDWLGAFFSMMSIVAQNEFDILAGVMYAACIALEIGIFLSHGIWMVKTKSWRNKGEDEDEEAAAEGVSTEPGEGDEKKEDAGQ